MSGGKFEFDDGGYYVGEWNEGQANGFGVCTGPNNLGKFEGLWDNGVEVSGVYTWPNRMQYLGQWMEGQRNGMGKEILGQMAYSGEWTLGLKHGSGTVRTGKEKRPCFEGTWKSGLQDGHGCEIYKEGGFYAGQWKEGCRHGYGIRGWAPIEQLQDGTISIKQLFASMHSRKDRPATICGIGEVFSDVKYAEENNHMALNLSTLLSEKPTIRKSNSTPVTLNRQFTFDDVKMGIMNEPKDTEVLPKKASSKHRVSVFKMVKNSFKRQESTTSSSETRGENEVYKGAWEGDQRHGYGICFYCDGSRFVGPWKENKRHGYGLLIERDGEKCGGKWYNDNLVLLTRRKNFKIPMVRKKIKHSVLAAVEAAEKATKKMRLAITRGLAARKIAEDSDLIAEVANGDAGKAQEFRQKYTLHPALEATLAQLSRQNTISSTESIPSGRSSPKCNSGNCSPKSNSSRKRSVLSLFTNEMWKKNIMVPAAAKRPVELDKIDIDVLHSFEKNPVSESALYAAMDTTIGAGALDPFLSQMVLMQYNDAHTRIAKAFTDRSALADKMTGLNESIFASTFVPMVINHDGKTDSNQEEKDACDSHSRSSSISSNLSEDSTQLSKACYMSLTSRKNSSWHSLPGLTLGNVIRGSPSLPRRSLLHPDDCSRKRRSGVANMSLHSDVSVSSEDARFIQMKGKLLTGDEVDYSYVALNTAVEGKDTVVLYTDHPRPKFNTDVSISDKNSVNSSTGLYRTLVGGVPRVLNFAAPTGIPSLDSREASIDSGTAVDEIDSNENTLPKNLYNSVPTKLNSYLNEQADMEPKYMQNKSLDLLNKPKHPIRFSYSPSFEASANDMERPPSYEEVTKHKDLAGKENNHLNDSTVQICQLSSSVSQVVINQPRRLPFATRETQTSEQNTPITKRKSSIGDAKKQANKSCEEERKMKFRLANYISKKIWGSKENVRSLSADSGYKHSVSLEDSTQLEYSTSTKDEKSSFHQSTDKIKPDVYKRNTFSGVMGTTVVTIENDKFRKLQSGAQFSNDKKTKQSPSSLHLSSNGSVFDQNKTIEGSPLPLRKNIQLPIFLDRNEIIVNENHPDQAEPGNFEEYVILDDLGNLNKTKQDVIQRAKTMTWV